MELQEQSLKDKGVLQHPVSHTYFKKASAHKFPCTQVPDYDKKMACHSRQTQVIDPQFEQLSALILREELWYIIPGYRCFPIVSEEEIKHLNYQSKRKIYFTDAEKLDVTKVVVISAVWTSQQILSLTVLLNNSNCVPMTLAFGGKILCNCNSIVTSRPLTMNTILLKWQKAWHL